MYSLAAAIPLPHGAAQYRGAHGWERGRRDVHGVSGRRQRRGAGRGGENGDGLVHPLVVWVGREGTSADVCCRGHDEHGRAQRVRLRGDSEAVRKLC